MRCKTCDYRLWNLKARQCPECGTPFTVSDYEFVPNSVQFCCPHCGQDYYGTGHNGHLVPEAFLCVKCGQSVHMNDMVLLPAEGLDEERTAPQRMPWLDRRHNGWWRSWWSTVKMSLTAPGRLIRSAPPETPASQAWRFAMATWLIVAGIGIAAIVGLEIITSAVGGRVPGSGIRMFEPILALLAGGILGLVALVLWAGLTHLALVVSGGTRGGLGRTCEAICYSAGTNVLLVIPICGMYVYWIWWLVSAAIMLKQRQRVHALRATLALMTLPMLATAGFVLMIWSFTHTFTATTTVTSPPTASAPATMSGPVTQTQMQTSTLAAILKIHAREHRGQGPRHVIELVAEGSLPVQLLATDSTPEQIPVGGTTLDKFGPLDGTQGAAVEAAIASLPPNVVAYRLGDFVFTYPGMDFNRCNAKLWTVIAWPDPDANPAAAPAEVTVGLLDGTTTQLYGGQMEMFLQDQNALRAKDGLAPLPHPATVRHGQPAAIQAEQEP